MNQERNLDIWRRRRGVIRGGSVVFACACLAGALGLGGCESVRFGNGPVLIEPSQLPPGVQAEYRTLADPAATLADRTGAVEQLLAMGGPDALDVLAWGLEADRQVQVNQAVLQGLVAAPAEAPEALVPVLMNRLGNVNPVLVDDLGFALERYEDTKITERLLKQARNDATPEPLRTRSIRMLGHRPTKPVAETLIKLTDTTRQPAVRSAAFGALATLTGISSFGEDRRAWEQWWDEAKSLDAANWEKQLRRNLARRDATQEIDADQLVDRLRDQSTALYRLAQPADKPRVLTDLLGEQLRPLRELGMTLAEQRLSAGEPFDEPLREALRRNLDDTQPEIRQRAAILLRDLDDGPAAVQVALKLVDNQEHVSATLRAYLLLLTRLPRPEAVDPAYALLLDPALQPQAAGVLASAAQAGMLTDGQASRIHKRVRNILKANPDPAPQVVTLLGRIDGKDAFRQIAGWVDHPDPAVRRAAAQAWADSDRSLNLLAQRAQDGVIQPIVITAAQQRGADPATLQNLAARPPAQPQVHDAWERALVAMSGRVPCESVLATTLALTGQPETTALRESMMTASLDAQPAGEAPQPGALALLLERAELRLGDDRPRLAVLDFETLMSFDAQLSSAQRDRVHRGLIRAALQTDQLPKAFGVARKLFAGPNGTFVQPAAGDPIIGLFIASAQAHVDAGRKAQARRLLDELRLLLGPKMKPETALRIRTVEQQLRVNTAVSGNGSDNGNGRGDKPAVVENTPPQPAPSPETTATDTPQAPAPSTDSPADPPEESPATP